MTGRPLDGVTVIDASTYVSASFGTMMLANLGADVVKIEPPDRGDPARGAGPPFVGGESPYFMTVNYGKESVELDLKDEDGKRILYDLVADADAFVENFRPGTAERLGIDDETLREHNEDLVYCSVSAFGESGPWRDRPGYDLLLQGMTGVMSVTGEADGPPAKAGIALTDHITGAWTAFGVLGALFNREATGEGDRIELAMYDGVLPWLTKQAGKALAGEEPVRMGSKDPVIAPYQSFQAADGYLNVAIGSEKLWTEFCEALGREDLLDDPTFRKNRNRVQHVDELEAELEATFRERAVDEWVADLMDDHGLPVGPVNPVSEALDNDHVEARDLLRDLDHPSVDEFPVVEQPLRFERANAGFEKHAPVLGETTVERLMDLGYTDDEIVALGERGVVGFPEGSVDG
jgi:crotonobetainyl-CoA:carnitine CoA-transferase CaiB-like acyl-CoA transferase